MINKRMIIFLVIIFAVLTINFVMNIVSEIDYQKRKDSGNARWEQVEERIKKIEEACGYDGGNG